MQFDWDDSVLGGTITANKLVAVEPFKAVQNQLEVKSGFATAKGKTALLESIIVFGSGDLKPGMKVYFDGDTTQLPNSKKIVELHGRAVVFVPEDRIWAVDTKVGE